MNVLTPTTLLSISAGTAGLISNALLVTDNSTISYNGLGFSAQGVIFSLYTSTIYIDFNHGGDSICLNGNKYTAYHLDNGYLFKITEC